MAGLAGFTPFPVEVMRFFWAPSSLWCGGVGAHWVPPPVPRPCGVELVGLHWVISPLVVWMWWGSLGFPPPIPDRHEGGVVLWVPLWCGDGGVHLSLVPFHPCGVKVAGFIRFPPPPYGVEVVGFLQRPLPL